MQSRATLTKEESMDTVQAISHTVLPVRVVSIESSMVSLETNSLWSQLPFLSPAETSLGLDLASSIFSEGTRVVLGLIGIGENWKLYAKHGIH
jgi:hypothetical protein